MTKLTIISLGLLAAAGTAMADNGPIPMRDVRQAPSVQQRAADRPYALTGSQGTRGGEWTRRTESTGGARDQRTVYTR